LDVIKFKVPAAGLADEVPGRKGGQEAD